MKKFILLILFVSGLYSQSATTRPQFEGSRRERNHRSTNQVSGTKKEIGEKNTRREKFLPSGKGTIYGKLQSGIKNRNTDIRSDATWEIQIEGLSGERNAWMHFINEDKNNNIVLVGGYEDPDQLDNIYLCKYDSLGNLLWETIYDGPASGNDNIVWNYWTEDHINLIHFDSSNNIHIVACITDTDFIKKIVRLRYDSDGTLQNVSFLPWDENERYYETSYKFGKDNYLYHAGLYRLHDTSGDWFVRQFDEDGNLINEYVPSPYSLYSNSRGIIGITNNRDGLPLIRAGNYIIQLDENLHQMWTTRLPKPYNMGKALAGYFSRNNNFYIMYREYWEQSFCIYDPYGVLLKDISVPGKYGESHRMSMDSEENILIYNTRDVFKYDNTGNLIAQKRFPYDISYNNMVLITGNNGYFGVGPYYYDKNIQLIFNRNFEDNIQIYPLNSGIYIKHINELGISRLSNAGYKLWMRKYAPPMIHDVRISNGIVDGKGNILVAFTEKDNKKYLTKIEAYGNSLWTSPNQENGEVVHISQLNEEKYLLILSDGPEIQFVYFSKNGELLKKVPISNDSDKKIYTWHIKRGKNRYFLCADYYIDVEGFNNNISGLLLIVVDLEGRVIDQWDDSFINSYYGVLSIGSDAEDNGHVLSYRGYAEHRSHPGIFNWSLANGFTFKPINFDFNIAGSKYGHRYINDEWNNFIVAYVKWSEGTGHQLEIVKISAKDGVVWNKPFGEATGDYFHHSIISSNNGKIILFIEYLNTNYEVIKRKYFLINRDGSVALEKDISEYSQRFTRFTSLKILSDDQILINGEGNSPNVILMDIETGTVKEEMAQTDIHGRSFNPASFGAYSDEYAVLMGNWGESYYGSSSTIIRFDLETIENDTTAIDKCLVSYGNYPNPFNGQTAIRYELSESGDVKIDIYNSLGQLLHSYKAYKPLGYHTFYFADEKLASGLYFYRINFKGSLALGKMVYIK